LRRAKGKEIEDNQKAILIGETIGVREPKP
jgi:hypothetical protein